MKLDEREFPSNAHTNKDPTTKKVERVVTGQVRKKRKSIGNTITQTLFGNDARSVVSYVFNDILIPAAKTTIQEMVSGGIDMLLFGEGGGRRSSRGMTRSIVSYGKFYKDRDGGRDSRGMRHIPFSTPAPVRSLTRNKYEDVVIEDRGEAEDALSSLVELIEQYGAATLADFYELVGLDGDFADQKYGWTNLSRAVVTRVREGYVIVFPRPHVLD